MKKNKKKAIPFFARLLEKEKFPKVKTDLKAGPGGRPPIITKRWPPDEF
jgi:hypothetical protein